MSEFERYIPVLRAWFTRRLRNPADVDDSVQDVWIRAQRHIDSGGVESVQAYLFQTAQSVLTDRIRRAGVRHETTHEPLTDHHHPVEEITPERVLMGQQNIARVVALLEQMPERTRDIFVLHRFENIGYGDIARRMGISVSAVEKHIMKALRILTDDLL